MKLTKISARNLKGQSFTEELSPITILVGGNFAGKSSRTDAMRLLLLGYLPELGKTSRATFGLSSGRDMEVAGEFEDGTTMRRTWTLKGDSVKLDEDIPPAFAEQGTLAVMLNAEEYFALTPNNRVEYVAAHVPLPDDVGANLEKAIPLAVAQRLGPPADESIQVRISLAIETAKVMAAQAKLDANMYEKTIQGLSGLRAQDVPQASIAGLDQERAGIVKEIEGLMQERATVAAEHVSADTNARNRLKLQGEVRSKESVNEMLTLAKASLEAKESELSAVPVEIPGSLEKLQVDEREAVYAVNNLSKEIRDADASIQRNNDDLHKLRTQEECPYCGAHGIAWHSKKESEIASAIAGLNVKHRQLVDHRDKVQETANKLTEQLRDLRRHIDDRARLNIDIGKLRNDVTRLQGQAELIASKEHQLAGIPAMDPLIAEKVTAVQQRVSTANDSLRKVDDRRKAALGRASELQRLAEAEKNRDAAKVDEENAKDAVEVLRELQRVMVATTFKPLLELANRFFGNILKSPLAYNDGEIGTWRNGIWVGHRTFSGTEKALCYAAIQAALASRSPSRIMLIDELGRLDNENAEQFDLAIVRAVQAGHVDQFIGIDAGRGQAHATLLTTAKCSFLVKEIK